jgi:hypothetical protein
VKSGAACTTSAPSAEKPAAASAQTDAISGSTVQMPRSGENATRFGALPRFSAAVNGVSGAGRAMGSPGSSPTMASSISARSETFRAIGPFTPRMS